MRLHRLDINKTLFLGRKVIAGHTPQVIGEGLDLGFAEVFDTHCR